MESHLGAQLAQRETLRFFPDMRDAEWVALDFWAGHYFYFTAAERWQTLRTDSRWETVTAGDGLLLLRRGAGPPTDIAEAFRPQISPPLPQLTVSFGEELILRGFDVHARPNGHLVLCSDWERRGKGALTPQLSLTGETFAPLDSLHFAPELFAVPGVRRDCTQLIAFGNVREPSVYFRVVDAVGRELPPVVMATGAWAEKVSLAGNMLYLRVKLR
ncbi:MAG TPA: hypothetical protein PK832_08260 [Anaerolineae bacterium]|nr:hypothetical protein [Anaerolineae bacterium]